jgi:hypothetical protein
MICRSSILVSHIRMSHPGMIAMNAMIRIVVMTPGSSNIQHHRHSTILRRCHISQGCRIGVRLSIVDLCPYRRRKPLKYTLNAESSPASSVSTRILWKGSSYVFLAEIRSFFRSLLGIWKTVFVYWQNPRKVLFFTRKINRPRPLIPLYF